MGLFENILKGFELKKKQIALEEKSIEFESKIMDQAIKAFEEASKYAKVTDTDEDKWSTVGTDAGVSISETDLETLRKQSRLMWETDPLAHNIIESSVDFVAGKGVTITPSKLEEDDFPNEEERNLIRKQTLKYWETFKRVNDFDNVVPEIVRRSFRDGECFIRWFFPESSFSENQIEDSIPRIRFIEPERIKDPLGNISHGIETEEGDYLSVKWYYQVDGNNLLIAKVPTEEMIHVKLQSDANCKRGRSILFPILKHLKYYSEWLKYRLILNKVRTAIVLVRTVKGSPTAIANLRSDRQSTTSVKSTKAQALEAGTIITAPEGIEYKFMAPQLDARDAQSDGREIKLSIAAGVGFPEMLVTSDFSNNTYSSSLTAQNPMVRKFQSWQTFFSYTFAKIYGKVIENGKKHWILNERTPNVCDQEFSTLIHRELKSEVEAYQAASESGVISKKTFAERIGLNWDTELRNQRGEMNESINIFNIALDKKNTDE